MFFRQISAYILFDKNLNPNDEIQWSSCGCRISILVDMYFVKIQIQSSVSLNIAQTRVKITWQSNSLLHLKSSVLQEL